MCAVETCSVIILLRVPSSLRKELSSSQQRRLQLIMSHAVPVIRYVAPAPVVVYPTPAPSANAVPGPVAEHVAPQPITSRAVPVIRYVAPAPVVVYPTPAPAANAVPGPVAEHVAPQPITSRAVPVIRYVAPAPVVVYPTPAPAANAVPGPVAEHAAPDPEEQNGAFLMGLENHTAKELLKGNLRLVSALWLMQRPPGWTVQKLQDLPEEALLPPETAAEMFLNPLGNLRYTVPRVVALSYRWLTPEHPDPDGVQLKQARQFLSKLLGLCRWTFHLKFNSPSEVDFKDAVEGKDVDVGVLWDFMSLPQQPRVTEDLKEQFREGLSIINRLYGSSANTLTLQLTGTPPGITGYHSSGWCLFEDAVSRLLKRTSLLCSMDETVDFHDRRFYGTGTDSFLGDPFRTISAFFAALGVEGCGFVYESEFLKIINELGAARKPPIHPENLAAILRSEKVKFTCGSDVELVIEKYRLFCEEVAGGVVILNFEATPREVTSSRTNYDPVEWSEDDMHLFSQAIVLFSKCQIAEARGARADQGDCCNPHRCTWSACQRWSWLTSPCMEIRVQGGFTKTLRHCCATGCVRRLGSKCVFRGTVSGF